MTSPTAFGARIALARRLGGAVLLLWLVVTITFLLVRLAPGDPAQLLVSPTASATDASRLRGELGLDRPLAVQYARWMGDVLRGNLGESFATHRPVGRVLREALPVSVWLGGGALLLTFLIGVPLGILQAARRGRALDRALTVATTLVYAAPSYWLALALVAVFTYGAATWGLPLAMRLPAFGMRSPGIELHGGALVADLVRHSVLPLTILAAIGAAGVARYARTSVADVLAQEWVRTARAKGASSRRVYLRHVLANILPAMLVLFALSFPGVVAGSIFVESVFAWPGMGRLMVTAIAARDYPVVLGATVWYAALVIFANLAADVALPFLDPRRAS
ncbi:MAG TPA: ABC transporter permease [Gemmatimonadaceae bacterium]|nr:ABC transporter permease [Gemmatimonadaceae bacterium]